MFVSTQVIKMDFERLGLCDELIRAVSDQYWESVCRDGTDLLEDQLIVRKKRFPLSWEVETCCW